MGAGRPRACPRAAGELALIEADHRRGRLSEPDYRTLVAFGNALLRRSPPLHLAVQLVASPAECLARGGDGGLALEELEELAPLMDAVPARLARTGTEVVPRQWGAFGKTGPVRDTLLCAPPQRAWAASLAPPSEAAVERLAQDAWAASQPGLVREASPSTSPSLSRRSSLEDAGSEEDYASMDAVPLMDLDAIGTPAASPRRKLRLSGSSPASVIGLHEPACSSPAAKPPAAKGVVAKDAFGVSEVFRAIDEAEAASQAEAGLAALAVS